MSRFVSIIGVAFIAIITVVLTGSCLLAQEIEIKMQDGMPVVYNPKEPVPLKGVPATLTLKLDITVGEEKGSQANHQGLRS